MSDETTPVTPTPKSSKKNATPVVLGTPGTLVRPPSATASIAARCRAAILKHTGQKPIQASSTTIPHISTGSLAVDMLIGGTPAKDGKGPICPGFPRRRITEVYGPESSGKTTLLLSAMVQAQRAGGCVMFVDFEQSLDLNYAKAIGIDFNPDKWMFFQPNNMEEGLQMMATGIAAGVDIVGVDSVAGMVPQSELEKKLSDADKVGALASKLARVLPKFVLWLQKHPMDKGQSVAGHPGTALVVLNQTRSLIQTGGYGGHGDSENTSGGKALKFFAYLRIRTSKIKAEVVERLDPLTGKKRRYPYGNLTDVKIVKSKVDAKQGHSTQMFIRYGFGIDDYYSIIESGVLYKMIRKAGSSYSLGEEKFLGKDKLRQYLVANPKVFEDIRSKLLVAIMSSAAPMAEEELSAEDKLFESMSDDIGDLDSDEMMAEAVGSEGDAEEVIEEDGGGDGETS